MGSALLGICLILAGAASPFAQPAPQEKKPPSAGATTVPDDTAALGKPYIDGHYGFSIRPPAGWRLAGSGPPEADGRVLIRMIEQVPGRFYHEITLRHTRSGAGRTIGAELDNANRLLALEFNGATLESKQLQEIAGRPGGFLSATLHSGGIRMLRMQAVVEFRPRQHLWLIYQGPLSLRPRSEPLFQRVVASLAILPNRYTEAQVRTALTDGAAWLNGISAKDLKKALVPETWYRSEIDGKEVGFLRVTHTPVTRSVAKNVNVDGVEVRERGWMFDHSSRPRRIQSNLFLSNDLAHESWKRSATTLVATEGQGPGRLEVELEEGLRTRDLLVSNQTYDMAQPSTVNPPVRLPPAYISQALVRLFPKLLEDPAEPRLLAFAEFDQRRSDLIIRVFDVKGRSEAPAGVVARGSVYHIEVYEGLASEPSNLYIDGRGSLLLMQRGPLRLTPARPDEIERRFGARAKSAERAMSQLERAYLAQERRFDRGRRSSPNP